jgi:type I restriction enzyme, R subunit
MAKHDTEADARILIDALLRQAGWDPADKSQVRTEVSVSGSAAALRDTPAGTVVPEEEEESRRTDFVLLAENGRPLAVTEAKRGRIDPYAAKQQVLPMAKYVGAPFIFLSNGEMTYFWDYENDNARIALSAAALSSQGGYRICRVAGWLRTPDNSGH